MIATKLLTANEFLINESGEGMVSNLSSQIQVQSRFYTRDCAW